MTDFLTGAKPEDILAEAKDIAKKALLLVDRLEDTIALQEAIIQTQQDQIDLLQSQLAKVEWEFAND